LNSRARGKVELPGNVEKQTKFSSKKKIVATSFSVQILTTIVLLLRTTKLLALASAN
jgi:hypothetical protein